MTSEIIVLFRPVGEIELKLIEDTEYSAFPPRLPEQPIFYPVTNEEYATQIARDWNTRFGSKKGFVTRFTVHKRYLDRFERRIVGAAVHEEYWIPAEELNEFNANIIGKIEVIATFEAQE